MLGRSEAMGEENGFRRLDDLQSFPILTEEVDFPTTPRQGVSGTPGTSALADMVGNALRDVLGWRPKANDSKNFVVALNQAFTLSEVEGHTVWTWTPQYSFFSSHGDTRRPGCVREGWSSRP